MRHNQISASEHENKVTLNLTERQKMSLIKDLFLYTTCSQSDELTIMENQ